MELDDLDDIAFNEPLVSRTVHVHAYGVVDVSGICSYFHVVTLSCFVCLDNMDIIV